MNRGFHLFPERASTIGGDVDALYFFLLAVSGIAVLLIAGSILFFALRYRRSRAPRHPQPVHESWRLELAWSVIPLILSLIMFGWGAEVFFRGQTAPAGALEIYVVGKQWMWKIEHPSGRREINELHVPVGRPVRLRLVSEDVIHSFYVPAFRVKQDVLPGRYTSLWFEATRPGEYHLFCAEYCGTNHSAMIGRVVALEPADFQQWLAGDREDEPMAVRGEQVFRRHRCHSCHGTDDGTRGPSLAGRFGEPARLRSGQQVAFDASYIRESILHPMRRVARGYEPRMPTYQNQIEETEILAIVDYLKRAGRARPSGPRSRRPAPLPEIEASE